MILIAFKVCLRTEIDLDSFYFRRDANYTFSATGRKVVNRIDAVFEVRDGKFVAHYDSFSFHKWAAQALGGVGSALGWTKVSLAN